MPPLVGSVLGRTEPRLWTPPLRALTPATSFGFEANDWARDALRRPPDPWQGWLNIHAGELLQDGRPRFRIVIVLVARQNGKTEVLVLNTLWWQFAKAVPLVLGTSTKLDYARESWNKSRAQIRRIQREVTSGVRDDEAAKRILAKLEGLSRKRWYREANGEQESWTNEDARYKIAAANEEGGRSLTIHRLIFDELRQHHDHSAWDAAEPATSAVWDSQVWCLSNAGDSRSIVLNELRDEALHFIETGEGDPRIGLFEWSAPPDADPEDIDALAQANPNLGYRIDPETLLAKARSAKRKGGAALVSFKTEYMCQWVPLSDPAVDTGAWLRGLQIGDLSQVRDRVVLVLDASPDGQHVTAVAAAPLPNGHIRVEPQEAWDGAAAFAQLRRALPGLVNRVRPRVLGWLPGGPMAAFAAELKPRQGRIGWPPPGVTVEEIKTDLPAVCMGFAEAVAGGLIVHSGDPLLDAHVQAAERLRQRNGVWVFSRSGGHCDAAYAAAGAVWLVRTLPPPIVKRKLLVV